MPDSATTRWPHRGTRKGRRPGGRRRAAATVLRRAKTGIACVLARVTHSASLSCGADAPCCPSHGAPAADVGLHAECGREGVQLRLHPPTLVSLSYAPRRSPTNQSSRVTSWHAGPRFGSALGAAVFAPAEAVVFTVRCGLRQLRPLREPPGTCHHARPQQAGQHGTGPRGPLRPPLHGRQHHPAGQQDGHNSHTPMPEHVAPVPDRGSDHADRTAGLPGGMRGAAGGR